MQKAKAAMRIKKQKTAVRSEATKAAVREQIAWEDENGRDVALIRLIYQEVRNIRRRRKLREEALKKNKKTCAQNKTLRAFLDFTEATPIASRAYHASMKCASGRERMKTEWGRMIALASERLWTEMVASITVDAHDLQEAFSGSRAARTAKKLNVSEEDVRTHGKKLWDSLSDGRNRLLKVMFVGRFLKATQAKQAGKACDEVDDELSNNPLFQSMLEMNNANDAWEAFSSATSAPEKRRATRLLTQGFSSQLGSVVEDDTAKALLGSATDSKSGKSAQDESQSTTMLTSPRTKKDASISSDQRGCNAAGSGRSSVLEVGFAQHIENTLKERRMSTEDAELLNDHIDGNTAIDASCITDHNKSRFSGKREGSRAQVIAEHLSEEEQSDAKLQAHHQHRKLRTAAHTVVSVSRLTAGAKKPEDTCEVDSSKVEKVENGCSKPNVASIFAEKARGMMHSRELIMVLKALTATEVQAACAESDLGGLYYQILDEKKMERASEEKASESMSREASESMSREASLEEYEAAWGARGMCLGNSRAPQGMHGTLPPELPLVDMVNGLLKESEHSLKYWKEYCDAHCGGKRCPDDHSTESLKIFFLSKNIWQEVRQALGLNEGRGKEGKEGKDAGATSESESTSPHSITPVGPSHALVQEVKATWAISGEVPWLKHCEARNAARDPAEHSTHSLTQYLLSLVGHGSTVNRAAAGSKSLEGQSSAELPLQFTSAASSNVSLKEKSEIENQYEFAMRGVDGVDLVDALFGPAPLRYFRSRADHDDAQKRLNNWAWKRCAKGALPRGAEPQNVDVHLPWATGGAASPKIAPGGGKQQFPLRLSPSRRQATFSPRAEGLEEVQARAEDTGSEAEEASSKSQKRSKKTRMEFMEAGKKANQRLHENPLPPRVPALPSQPALPSPQSSTPTMISLLNAQGVGGVLCLPIRSKDQSPVRSSAQCGHWESQFGCPCCCSDLTAELPRAALKLPRIAQSPRPQVSQSPSTRTTPSPRPQAMTSPRLLGGISSQKAAKAAPQLDTVHEQKVDNEAVSETEIHPRTDTEVEAINTKHRKPVGLLAQRVKQRLKWQQQKRTQKIWQELD